MAINYDCTRSSSVSARDLETFTNRALGAPVVQLKQKTYADTPNIYLPSTQQGAAQKTKWGDYDYYNYS